MALLFIEGFEQYDDDTGLTTLFQRGGWKANTSFTFTNYQIQAGRHAGSQGIRTAFGGRNLYHEFPETQDFTVGIAFKVNAVTAGQLIGFRYNLVDHLTIFLTNAGEIQLVRGISTQIDITSGLGLQSAQWYYLEVNANIHDSTGDYDVHLDGLQLFSDTGVDTQNGSSALVNNIELMGTSGWLTTWDDIYVLDDSGSDNVGILGDCRVETVFPDALGNENDFTASPAVDQHLNVDDGINPDDDTSYNHSATATDRELYGFAALAGNVGTVFGVDAKMLVRKEEAGFREVRVIGRSNVTEVESASFTLGVSWVYKNHIFENDPDGGGNWDEAAVNAAQFGLDLQT